MREHSHKWVTVVSQKVVSSGETIEKVCREGIEKTGDEHIHVIFVESAAHVYYNQAPV